jgi:hypothetical protein
VSVGVTMHKGYVCVSLNASSRMGSMALLEAGEWRVQFSECVEIAVSSCVSS